MQFETRPEVQPWGNDKSNVPLNVKEVPAVDAEGNAVTHYQADILCKVKNPVTADSIVEAAVSEKYSDADRLRIICLVVIAFMTAAIVSYVGLIGFVGLVVPHVVRMIIGADNRFLIPASISFGAALLLLADLVGKVIIAPATIQVGVIMAFLGGPMFIWLIVRKNSKVWG